MIKKHIFLTIILTFFIMVFAISVRAQGATPTYRFRCSTNVIVDTSDTGWQDYHADDSCSAQIGTGTGQVYVYVQFEKTENNQKTKTPVYIVYFNYMSTPVATPVPGAATATPTLAAGGATVTPTPTPVATPKACVYTKTEDRWCCPAPSTLCISPNDAAYDYNCDCLVRSPDHAIFIKHWSK